MKVLIGNFKGPKGDTGEKGDKGNKGDRGEQGQRGSRWESGTNITGTDTVGTKFPNSGITDAQPLDHYINSDTGNLYECSVPGTADTAEWVYIGSFKGPKGDTGPAGSISDINEQKPTYSEASELEELESGETVKKAFGKLGKAVLVLISHYTQKAAYGILGHVKLSNSAAITTTGEYALDAVEKNASVEGTLANLIQQTNSNLANDCYLLHGGQAINENANLDDYKTPGNYYCALNAIAATLSNCPITEAFTLKVEMGNGISYPCQTLRNFHNGQIFYRFFTGNLNSDNGWDPWYTMPVQVAI